jgi:hypothetical protein
MTYEDQLSLVNEEMTGGSEIQMERRCDGIIRELDEIVALAANPETVALVEQQRVAVGQILSRAQLIASFLMARQPQLKVMGRG